MPRITVTIDAGDPAFDGHFPGLPILPGVVLLAEVFSAIERVLDRPLGAVTIRAAKFHAPVSPDSTLDIDIDLGTDKAAVVVAGAAVDVRFSVGCGETRVASGSLIIASDDTPPATGRAT